MTNRRAAGSGGVAGSGVGVRLEVGVGDGAPSFPGVRPIESVGWQEDAAGKDEGSGGGGRPVDVMGGALRQTIRVLDHGFVALVDVMPRLVAAGQTADSAVVQAARVSYGVGTKKVNEDRGLIRYLLRHRHTTPFEMVEFKFHIAMPIFVARQWIRHRTANVNEYSARYSILTDRFYRPSLESVRKQSSSNRQGGEETFVVGHADHASDAGAHAVAASGEEADRVRGERQTAEDFLAYLDDVEKMYSRYVDLTDRGVSRELARIGLPVSIYTEWYWKCDLHNLLRFLSLRMDAHAQQEIRVFAEAMHRLIEPIVPMTVEAFLDYEMESLRLTRLEIEAVRSHAAGTNPECRIDSENSREQREWAEKRARLGLGLA